MKNIKLLGCALAATTVLATTDAVIAAEEVVVAGPAVVVPAPVAGCPKAFQGFHFGANIGYGIGKGKRKFEDTITEAALDNNKSFSGVDGGIGIGYTHRLCNWAVGLAFDANWTGVKGHDKAAFGNNNVTIKARLRNSLQLYGRLGYVIREVAMPFVALGWDNSQWKQSTDVNVAAGQNIISSSVKKSKRINSLLWKVGADFLATRHFIVGFEYTGTAGGKVRLHKDHAIGPNEGTYSSSVKPQYNKFALTAKIVY